MSTPHINIIARTNGVGLDQDVNLIHSALTAVGMQVTVSHVRSIPFWKRWFPQSPKYDANIFLERVFPRWFGTASKNLLIPNQERFPHRQLKNLNRIDTVLCKSRHAEKIFSQHCSSTFIGFTSEDRFQAESKMDYQSYFHLAGRSTLKGTETLLDIWRKHPEWPELTLIQSKDNALESVPNNVNLITEYVSTEKLLEHLNHHGVHLCPSLSEGWGHYIMEALSCQAVAVTTDAPPMNELVSNRFGLLIPFHKSEPRHLGVNFFVDPEKLETQLSELIQLSNEAKAELGKKARQHFLDNDSAFKLRFVEVINQLLSK